MEKEIWKHMKYPSCEDVYFVSNLGRVRNIETRVLYKAYGDRYPMGSIMNLYVPSADTHKKLFTGLLVLKTFKPNPTDFRRMTHEVGKEFSEDELTFFYLDGDPCNNRLDNLVWCTKDYRKYVSEENKRRKLVSKKLYFTSDIHGFYDEFKTCLENSGFDESDEDDLLVVLGDSFDRGPKSKEVYLYLSDLESRGKCVVIHGNHDKFLIDFLEHADKSDWNNSISFNYMKNGLNETIASFLDRTLPFESWCFVDDGCEINGVNFNRWVDIARHEIMDSYPDLLDWLKRRPRYFESKRYIGVHSAIDTKVVNWRNPHCSNYNLEGWDALDFDDGRFFSRPLNDSDKHYINKTIIIGHFGTRLLREMYPNLCSKDVKKDKDDILIRDDNKIIALDGTTVLTHKVNFYIDVDELYEDSWRV